MKSTYQHFKAWRNTLSGHLLTVNLLTMGLALVVTLFISLCSEFYHLHHRVEAQLRIQAQMIASHAPAALMFDDRKDAAETLATLHVSPEILRAEITGKGQTFVSYRRERPDVWLFDNPERYPVDGLRYRMLFAETRIPVTSNAEQIGEVWVLASLKPFYVNYLAYASLNVLATGTGLVMAFFLLQRLQRKLTYPIAELAKVVERVTKRHDYSQRALAGGSEEISALADGINDMLASIEERDRLLESELQTRQQREQELRLAAITFQTNEAILITDGGGTILRVNQAFSDITGYSERDAVGRHPSILRSDYHENLFYRKLWRSVLKQGQWRGEIWNRKKSGELYAALLSITAVKNEQGITSHYVVAFSDITLAKKSEEDIRHLAFYDPLTRLANRRLLLEHLQRALHHAARHSEYGVLLFLDLDNFKTLNDTLGHSVGDQLLEQVAARLLQAVRATDTVARLGGDEFVVLIEGLKGSREQAADSASLVAEKIHLLLNQPFVLGTYLHQLSPSIGITLFFDEGLLPDDVLKQADLAMYRSKAAGRNTVRFYEESFQESFSRNVQMEANMRRALSSDEFDLHFQPQYDGTGNLIGAEALLRWERAGSFTSPALFVPLAEETGLILPIGQWVLRAALARLALWQESKQLPKGFKLAVNISPRQFRQKDFVDQVVQSVTQMAVDPVWLKFEITEGVVIENIDDTIAKIAELKRHGIDFSIDDFGTGYSSLSYLRRLPLSEVKIDRSFVQDIDVDANSAVIVKTIIAMSQQLGFKTIAEGVETARQLTFLADCGCQGFQGYWFSPPQSSELFVAEVFIGGKR